MARYVARSTFGVSGSVGMVRDSTGKCLGHVVIMFPLSFAWFYYVIGRCLGLRILGVGWGN